MKLKKLLASILALAMVLSTMGTVVFAADGDGITLARVEAENKYEGNAQILSITFGNVPTFNTNMTVKLYHDDELLSTTNVADKYLNSLSGGVSAVVLYSGDPEVTSWTTEINAPWTIDRAPNKIVLDVDGTETVFEGDLIADFTWGKFEQFDLTAGTITPGYTNNTSVWGEGTANANESFVVELYAGDERIAQASLKDYEDIIDGDVHVTWNINFKGDDSEYWDVEWYGNNPSVDTVPTKVVLVVDGVKVAENEVQMNAADNLYPVEWDKLEGIPAAAKIGDKRFATLDEALAALANGSEMTIFAGEYDTEFVIDESNVSIVAEGEVIINGTPFFKGQNQYIEGIVFNYEGEDRQIHNACGTYKDCVFNATGNAFAWCYPKGDITFDGCTFNPTGDYALHIDETYNESDLTLKDCKVLSGTVALGFHNSITCENSSFKGYAFNSWGTTNGLTFTECDFELERPIRTGDSAEHVVTFNDCTSADNDVIAVKGTGTVVVNGGNEITGAVAQLGNKYFGTLQAAVDAAVEGNNEIVIAPGTYDESFMVNQEAGKNITIKAENKGDVTLTGTISVNGNRKTGGTDKLTIENIVFDGSDKTAAHDFIIDSNGTPKYPTYAHNVTVYNCDFIGNGDFDKAVVAFREANAGSYNIVFDSVTATGLYSLMQVSNSDKITVTNSTITDGESVVNANGSGIVIFTNNIVDVDNFAVRTGRETTTPDVTMTGNTIYAGVTALALRDATATVAMKENSIVAPAVFTNENSDASKINGVGIAADGIDAAVNDNNVVIAAEMTISFDKVEPGLYNIVLTAADDIYEFVGAELTFQNSSTTVGGADTTMNYAILGIDGKTNAEKSIEKADKYALRLVDGAERMSGKELIIGQVVFYGQGDINFGVTEGKVVTTEYGTNLGQYYTLDADETTTDTLVAIDITNGKVEEVKRDVVVNVAYNHALDGTYWSDNQITVTLKDGFGNVSDPQDISNGVVTFKDVKLGRLTVTLEAPGFRKYVYNTTLEPGADEDDALVLNFWNNVKRNEELNGVVIEPLAEIETGKGFMAHNFVVGDIVMDYTVDEYDLAAVTSYYGMYELDDTSKIRYDLNRDGNIDIIDVHYVLHTLNN